MNYFFGDLDAVWDPVVGQICALLMHPEAAASSSVRSATECPFHSATLYVSACMRVIHVALKCKRMLVYLAR